MMPDARTERPTVHQLRHELALGADDRLDLTSLPPDAFAPTFELTTSPWPDFLASDIADWPSRLRDDRGPVANGIVERAYRRLDASLVIAFSSTLPPLPLSLKVMLLRHQTSGHWAGEFRCAAIPLDMSDQGIDLGNDIAERWHATNAALGWAPLEDLVEYRGLLQGRGLDCNESYRHFAEGVYPVDLDDHALQALAVDGQALLNDLSPDELSSACLVFLAPNSAAE